MEKYFGNVMSSFENGVQLDLRVKLAMEFLKSNAVHQVTNTDDVVQAAELALDLATELLAVAHERGLVKDMPDNGELSSPMKHHLERSVRQQMYGNEVAQKIARETIAPVPGRVLNG